MFTWRNSTEELKLESENRFMDIDIVLQVVLWNVSKSDWAFVRVWWALAYTVIGMEIGFWGCCIMQCSPIKAYFCWTSALGKLSKHSSVPHKKQMGNAVVIAAHRLSLSGRFYHGCLERMISHTLLSVQTTNMQFEAWSDLSWRSFLTAWVNQRFYPLHFSDPWHDRWLIYV